MAKEFDIRLNKRLTECDILVYSIPYRECLTVQERLILESCLECYKLQKFIAAENSSALLSHIDKMIKICKERLSDRITLGVDSKFRMQSTLSPNESNISLSSTLLKTQAVVHSTAENALRFGTRPVDAYVLNPIGHGEFELGLNNQITSEQITKYETVHNAVNILSDIAETALKFITPDENLLTLTSEVEAIVKRYRMLYEMDSDVLADYDEMSLDDVDYVILQE